jgi:hypothetical protein
MDCLRDSHVDMFLALGTLELAHAQPLRMAGVIEALAAHAEIEARSRNSDMALSENTQQPPSEDEVRLRFLDFYSKQAGAHATYLLSLAVVLFIAVQVVISTKLYEQSLWAGALAVVVLATISTGGVYNLAVALKWSAFAGGVVRYDGLKDQAVKGRLEQIENLIQGYAWDGKGTSEGNPDATRWPAKFAKAYHDNFLPMSFAFFAGFVLFYSLLLHFQLL